MKQPYRWLSWAPLTHYINEGQEIYDTDRYYESIREPQLRKTTNGIYNVSKNVSTCEKWILTTIPKNALGRNKG